MTIKKVNPKELNDKLQKAEKVFLLDVRSEEKYNDFHITDSLVESHNIPKTVILGQECEFPELPKDKEIIVTCTTGNSAAKCAEVLDSLGFNVKVLEGGVSAWKEYRK